MNGTTFVIRQLASRKTTACIKHFFRCLITSLAKIGLKDLLAPTLHERTTLSIDFEKTYGYAFSENLAAHCHPEKSLKDFRDMYAEILCFACNFHEQRVIK